MRVMLETGMRASECLNLAVADVDATTKLVIVRRGKGGGVVPCRSATRRLAVDRYKRVRALHKLADSPRLWLGDRGQGLAYSGLHAALRQRADSAGIEQSHPHMLRHTSAHRWLAAGGSETGAMAMHGWSSPEMLQRYGRANRERRAIDEARRLVRGELD